MFITIEDETGVANLVLWADRFEKQRRLVLSAGMIACHGRVQREGEVVHVVTDHLEDLSGLLRSVGSATNPSRSSMAAAMVRPTRRAETRGLGQAPDLGDGRCATSMSRTFGSARASRCRRAISDEMATVQGNR